ncbi:2512_t:CDS:10 [Scutellospora calospora]|uniref:2512_t:CDS:1 n=1 Tax=Scutellospora calospora TaxID=85575 RepID=A0ACA9LFD7_9GLOM|nr:2512_t:CDS:10 [Scutellospora calospora]
MSAQSISILMIFYHVTAIEDWTCVNITNYYQEKTGEKERKKILDYIKKDLGKVLNPDFDFDVLRKRKAQEILNTWKVISSWDSLSERNEPSNSHEFFVRRLVQAGLFVYSDELLNWSSLKNSLDSHNTCVKIGHLQINDNDCQDINFACDTTEGVRNFNTEKKEVPIVYIQPKNLKRKCDADKENLEINGSSDNNNIKSMELKELELNHEINISENEISDFYPLSEVESDFNEAESGSESLVQKYPNVDSPKDHWLLPSGRSIKSIIYGQKNLHKSHPSHFGIIRIGAKVRKPEWIEDEDWNYLNSSVEFPHFKLSSNTEELLTLLLETDSLTEYKKAIREAKYKNDVDAEMEFVTDVLWWFANNVFNTASAFHGIHKNEALLGSSMIHPILQYLMNTTDRITYIPGEIYLKANANQRLLRRNLKSEDDKPLGMEVDGIFHTPGNKGLEIGMVELSGGYLTSDTPRYVKDHVKGCWGCRDILNDIVKKYNHGDYKILRNLRTWFFHIHGQEVQVWGMDLPVSKVYRMFLIGTFYLPINWDEHNELVHALRILWNLGRGLDNSFKLLEEFKKSHRRNTALHSQSSILKDCVGNVNENSPLNPTSKRARIINPHSLTPNDHGDSNDNDPPSPSPSGVLDTLAY